VTGQWLHTEMVHSSVDGHPSKYEPGLASIDFADATNDVTD